MRAIMIMYDSLNRHYMPNYGCDLAKMPNFRRLGERTATFDNCYVGSLPCMPARRELHTGRLNFLHRGWTPLEPFDDSMPEILKQNGVHSHLVSDHQHYWEDGGATYHTRYKTWDCVRGQEGDPWKAYLGDVRGNTTFGPGNSHPLFQSMRRQDQVNRSYIKTEEQFPQARTFEGGMEFIETNQAFDNWFLQIETFDPHEPFFTPDEYQALYREEGEEPFGYDWPPYGPKTESDEFMDQVRRKYLALLSMCDTYMGKVLDMMDRFDMWKDTMLVVNTDHGFLLGEHLWWAKGTMPTYNELAHIPLFIWDPRTGVRGERRQALVQSIDLAPTLLEFFGMEIPRDMQGFPLKETVATDKPVRECALFGFHSSHINITDGRYLYMRAPVSPDNQPICQYTLMPTLMRARMSPAQLADIALAEPFPFTKGCRTLKIPSREESWGGISCFRYGNRLYDLKADPGQLHPIDDPEKELELIAEMARLMRENGAPEEQYARVGIPQDGKMTREQLLAQREAAAKAQTAALPDGVSLEGEAYWLFVALSGIAAGIGLEEDPAKAFGDYLKAQGRTAVGKEEVMAFVKTIVPPEDLEPALFTLETAARLG